MFFRNWFHAAALFSLALVAPQAALATSADVPATVHDEPDQVMTADMIAREAAGAGSLPSPSGDFRSAFDAWRKMDGHGTATAAIALPSRKPIDAMSLSSSFGMRVHPVTGQLARHNGIDIPAPRGTPIFATADGVVGRAQRLGAYGLYVEIEHGSGIQTRYGHMSQYIVQSGQRVKQGDIIGYVGSTGRSTGNHLHYEVRIAGAPVNPLPFVQQGDAMLAMKQLHGRGAMGGPE